MNSPFFLTRQTANLMEDFTREVKSAASLFLLYGDAGVGKTRLLHELSQQRLSDATIHWIDLAEESSDPDGMRDRSAQLEEIFESAHSDDIIIADNFDTALKKTRHQLFLSWSRDGIDKKLNLIIVSSSEGFNELRQLSQQYQVPVQSFQQMPFNPDEVEAFIGFYLFPNHPIGKLSIPAALRKQLLATNGAVGQIIEIAEREGKLIETAPMTDTESIRQGSRIIVAALILVALTIGVGWYFLSSQYDLEEVTPLVANDLEVAGGELKAEPEPEAEPEPVKKVMAELDIEPANEVVVEPEIEPVNEVVVDPEIETADETVASLVLDNTDEPITATETKAQSDNMAAPETETALATESAAQANAQDTISSEPDTVSVIQTATVEEENATLLATAESSTSDQAQVTQSAPARFQLELQKSSDWINSNEAGTGTIQILLLSFARFDTTAYHEYVDNLASREVDISRIRVFKTFTGKRPVYSVFYGQYASRRAALKAIKDLPDVLREASPIPRSVGGILQEIRRLEVGN